MSEKTTTITSQIMKPIAKLMSLLGVLALAGVPALAADQAGQATKDATLLAAACKCETCKCDPCECAKKEEPKKEAEYSLIAAVARKGQERLR